MNGAVCRMVAVASDLAASHAAFVGPSDGTVRRAFSRAVVGLPLLVRIGLTATTALMAPPMWLTSFMLLGVATSTSAQAATGGSEQGATEWPRRWQFAAGLTALALPEYPGSDSRSLQILPALDLRHGRWFLRSADGVGVDLLGPGDAHVSLSIAPEFARRREGDDARLAGLGDVDRTLRAQLRIGHAWGPVFGRGRFGVDIGGQGQGTIADLEAGLRSTFGSRWRLEGGVGARWANSQFTRTFFGVEAEQAARSGLAPYPTGSGWSARWVFAGVHYDPAERWRISARLRVSQLMGDAVDSPVTARRTLGTGDLSVSYRFY